MQKLQVRVKRSPKLQRKRGSSGGQSAARPRPEISTMNNCFNTLAAVPPRGRSQQPPDHRGRGGGHKKPGSIHQLRGNMRRPLRRCGGFSAVARIN